MLRMVLHRGLQLQLYMYTSHLEEFLTELNAYMNNRKHFMYVYIYENFNMNWQRLVF